MTILSDTPDFQLFGGDDSFPIQEQHSKLQSPQRMGPIFTGNPSNPPHAGAQYPQHFPQGNTQWYPATVNYGKPAVQQQHFYNSNGMNSYNDTDAMARAQHALYQQQHHRRQEDEDVVPDLSPCHSHMPTSGRPSVSETDMPATPVHSPVRGHYTRERTRSFDDWFDCLQTEIDHAQQGPKLHRTISDAVQDELFNPGIAPGTARAQGNVSLESPQSSSQFNGLYQQAQSQHALAARASPVGPVMAGATRDTSPFRANSPFHPARTNDPVQVSPRATFLPVAVYPSARARRELEKEREAEALKIQMQKDYEECQKAPRTISPKDAYTEFTEPEGEGVHGSLFEPSQQESYSSAASMSDSASAAGSYHDDDVKTEGSYGSMATSRRTSNANVPIDYSVPMFQHHQYNQNLLDAAAYGWPAEHSSQEGSDPLSRTSDDYDYDSRSPMFHHRPEDVSSNSGAYSCTVHGCPQRFPTASKMSKHRREAHRHGTPMNREAIIRSQHQGPHRCSRINPTTNKPCNVIFSRPYDLTRHEDTIHNSARQKVRCEICNDEKTFSRHDALTRHKKVIPYIPKRHL